MKELHRAPWVAPMTVQYPLIENGGIVCENGKILAVARASDLREYDIVYEHDGILTPGLVNGHAHLELSYLADLSSTRGDGTFDDMTQWIRELIARRNQTAADEVIRRSSCSEFAGMHDSGCVAVADIGNQLESYLYGCEVPGRTLFFLEFIGLSVQAQEEAFQRIYSLTDEINCTVHAPYSVTPELIIGLKKRAKARRHPFPIHVAESREEMTFMQDGTGPFRQFLEDVGVWDNSFVPPGCSSVAYLERLGVLDADTLCVHGVQLDQMDIEILAGHEASVCLCPGSNRFLGVGVAPVGALLQAGILPALGTDSLASNPVMNLWREMRILREDHPGIDPEKVFAMATRGGARALGIERDYGSLEIGKQADILNISCPDLSRTEVFEYLTAAAESAEVTWIADRGTQ